MCLNGRSILDLTKIGAYGGVGYLQPRGRVSSPSTSSNILQHLKVLHVRVRVCFVAFELRHLLSNILQHLKVNKRLQTLISQQLYTQSLYSIHPINRVSKAGADVVNTISSLRSYRQTKTSAIISIY